MERTKQKLCEGRNVRLVALGDSLTYGWMVPKGYLDYLVEMLQDRYPGNQAAIINRGVPGDTAFGGLQRLHADVLAEDPDAVMIQFALNDLFCGCTVAQYREAIVSMITTIESRCRADVLLVTPVVVADVQQNALVERFCDCLVAVAEQRNTAVARVQALWRRRIAQGDDVNSLVQPDGVHPTAAGYRIMAEAVMQCFL